MTIKKYDLIVIGGGSGGVRAARIAALNGAKVALCEKDRMGGTCVIRGCIPKKLFFYSAQFRNQFKYARDYGWGLKQLKPNIKNLVYKKDIELKRLENIYNTNSIKAGVEIYKGQASFKKNKEIKVNNKVLNGKNIIIATGGLPNRLDVKGGELCINSDEIMQLKKIPKNLTIIGAGYIAIEFAFIFSLLGSKVTIICRTKILRGFDKNLVDCIINELENNNIKVFYNEEVLEIKSKNKYRYVHLKNNKLPLKSDQVLCAIGRTPNIDELELNNTNIKFNKNKAILVNKFLETNVKDTYAIGDVTDRINLTPVAIIEGQLVAENLFAKKIKKRSLLTNIGSAVFSSPPICSVGPTEEQAKKQFKRIFIYESKFISLKYSIVKRKIPTYIKIIVNGYNNKIIGGHMFGDDAPEIIQLIGVTIEAGATFEDFKNTLAIHPTVAEELVTFKEFTRQHNLKSDK